MVDHNTSDKLTFSQNAVLFDTVFTTVGSTVQAFLVHNNHNKSITISNVKLVGNYTSPFKINIDGTPGTAFNNITIPANDSIYVFVTVTLNPNNVNNPIVIEDSLQFTTNGNVQYVYLQAWGQDAYFHVPNVFPAYGPAYSIAKCGDVWTNDKPHVIFGYFVVDSGCTLTMEPGTRVYMHNNAVLWVYKDGSLQINGQTGAPPITIQGDRLEPEYQNVPGQWGEIWLSALSENNYIHWAVIKNGTVGVEADTNNPASGKPTLELEHTIIKSMSNIGLLGEGANIRSSNTLVADCQNYCVDLSIGGKYFFAQCTFANYWSYGQRQTPLLLLNNWYQDVNGINHSRPLDTTLFVNCIVYGSLSEEIQFDSALNGAFHYIFQICDLDTKQNTSNLYHYSSTMLINQDPQFANTALDNYNIPLSSPVVAQGADSTGADPKYNYDLGGNLRVSVPYDLGAYAAH